MKRWCIAVVLIAALLLVGAAGAVKPVKEPVDKVVLIHYKDGVAAKPAPVLNAASFKLLGMKWKAFPVRYYVNPSNGDGLAPDVVTASVTTSFATWDEKTTVSASPSGDLFRYEGLSTVDNQVGQDQKNLIYWGSMGATNSNIIAMTSIWYTRATKEIIETDIQMNDDMKWGIGVSSAYDVQNIATHEAGHVCGLADLYSSRDTALTMYGYGSPGEVKKRDLAAGDIAGLVKLYGA